MALAVTPKLKKVKFVRESEPAHADHFHIGNEQDDDDEQQDGVMESIAKLVQAKPCLLVHLHHN